MKHFIVSPGRCSPALNSVPSKYRPDEVRAPGKCQLQARELKTRIVSPSTSIGSTEKSQLPTVMVGRTNSILATEGRTSGDFKLELVTETEPPNF
jgi:hypothetical protein